MKLRRRSSEDRLQYMEDQVIRLAVERNAALSVLRDLVALADDEDGKRHAAEWFARSNAIMARTGALVAEHTTDKETT